MALTPDVVPLALNPDEIVIVHRIWSVPSVKALKIFRRVQEREAASDVMRVVCPDTPEDTPWVSVGGQLTHGWGETFLVREGVVREVCDAQQERYEELLSTWVAALRSERSSPL